jgi:transcriptional repressor NrdR
MKEGRSAAGENASRAVADLHPMKEWKRNRLWLIFWACETRPVSAESIETMVDEVEKEIHREAGREVLSSKIGEMVMDRLQKADKIAYIRFASVYRKFEDISEFIKEVKEITLI